MFQLINWQKGAMVNRYSLDTFDGIMDIDHSGGWVDYSDYLALEEKIEELRNALAAISNMPAWRIDEVQMIADKALGNGEES